jgi:hypothetical protein
VLPTGEELLETSRDGGSGFNRVRRAVTEAATDVGENVGKAVKLNFDLLHRPTGPAQAETRAPETIQAAQQDFSLVDAFSAMFVGVVVVPQAIHWAVGRAWRRIRGG